MDIVTFVVVCLFVGIALYFINAYVPMQPTVKRILNIGVVILLVLWVVVNVLGVTHLGTVRVG